ncbi:recombinase family protein [Chakrabartyella piscis]|uniref:recombinase family protein n=1 Tax=Chakrabartyella piscis TaxID=2918914 RepID=UPI0029584DD9|nr:recombinase family protein [Chakrabartyella piscis]
MEKTVKIIPPVKKKVLQELKPKLKVCAYCRVSTDSTKQHTSYIAQAEYYESYIKANDQWDFVGVYADESSGTKLKNRDDFNRMIKDCERDKINLIITKSITRFARNTVDLIDTVRNLKSMGVDVYFEKEKINTMSTQSELMLSILSSIAQSESENISENSKWSVQKRFRDGTFRVSCIAYGYVKDQDGEIIIDAEKSKIVRRIFDEYLSGKGTYLIAKGLIADGIETARTSEQWGDNVIKVILQNPIYQGELVLQKTYTAEGVPFIKKKNNGELPMFSIKDNHEPIVSKEEFQAVQEVFEYRRKQAKIDDSGKNQNLYEFSGNLICKQCGNTFRRQKIYIRKPYEKVQWCCKTHIYNKGICDLTAVRDDVIKSAFCTMWNKLVSNYEEILLPLLDSLKQLRMSEEEQAQLIDLKNKIFALNEQSRILSRVASKGYMDSAIFISEQTAINVQVTECKREMDRISDESAYEREIAGTLRILQIIRYNPQVQMEYQEEIFKAVVEKVYIGKDITFKLINSLELTEEMSPINR